MSDVSMALLLLAGAITVFLVGKSLIHVYFCRKEEFVNALQSKLKGKLNGSSE